MRGSQLEVHLRKVFLLLKSYTKVLSACGCGHLYVNKILSHEDSELRIRQHFTAAKAEKRGKIFKSFISGFRRCKSSIPELLSWCDTKLFLFKPFFIRSPMTSLE